MVNKHNRAKIVQMKEAQREEAKEMQLNPDLSGPFTWPFRHFEIPPGERCAVPSGKYEDVPVTIYGKPGRNDVKKKCWWIHSDVGGFGKTYFLDKFEETYNAKVVRSSKNCTGIPKNTQFLLFDETGMLSDFDEFKQLTSRKCTTSFNRKMAGADYIPREDVQVIVCANQSPYEFFGKYDPKLQRKMMPPDWVTQIEQRVHYVRLDGDGEVTRRQFMHVTAWSGDEFKQELKVLRKASLKGKDDAVETSEFLQHALQLYKTRVTRGRSLEDFIETCLYDGNDIRLARMIFQKNLSRSTNSTKLDQWRREAFFESGGNDRKNYLPVSPEEIHRGLMRLRGEIGEVCLYQDQYYLDAAFTYPRKYAKYLNERVLIERPEPAMTKEDLATICIPRGRKRRHSECTDNFRDGGRIICDDAADLINVNNINDFDLWRCANAINKIRKMNTAGNTCDGRR
jgi:hypothetical protein